MELELADRVALVTGDSGGIGFVIARKLAGEGARLVITARRQDVLQNAARALTAHTGRSVLGVPADTRDEGQVERLAKSVQAQYSRIDILVNCAASPAGLTSNRIEDLDPAALLQDLDTKVVGYARCCKAVVPAMKRARWGRIINIGRLTGRASNMLTGMRNVALCQLTKTLSDQLGPDGITVNVVHPGVIRTPHLTEPLESEARRRGGKAADVEAVYVAETPVRRLLTAEDIASTIAFLASPHARAITGESIRVDGGITRGIYL